MYQRNQSDENKLFCRYSLSDKRQEVTNQVITEISQVQDREITFETISEIQQAKLRERQLSPLVLDEEHITTDTDTRTRNVVMFFVPFSGDLSLLDCKPSSHYTVAPQAEVRGNEVVYTYDTRQGVAAIKEKFAWDLDLLKKWVEESTKEVQQFNQGLDETVARTFNERWRQIENNHKIQDELGYPKRPHTEDANEVPPQSPTQRLMPMYTSARRRTR